jgi:voltage-gated potassium channel
VSGELKTAKGDRLFQAQGPAFAIALLVLVIAGGTLEYYWIEHWDLWRAFYVTILAISTLEAPRAVTLPGQVVTVFLVIGGVSAALYLFTLLGTVVVEGGLPKRLQRRRLARMIQHLQDHFIICGYGRIGSIVANQLQRQGVPYIVIERDPGRLQQAIEDGALAVEADASREDVLKRVGIERARGLIAAVGTDAENVYAVLSARVMRPDLFIVSRAETDDATMKLKRAGANRVISPYQLGGVQIAQTALRPAVVDFVALATSADNLELALEEITIDAPSSLANRSIIESNLRGKYGVIVVGIQRQDGKMEFNPESDSVMRPNDKLVVLGKPDALRKLEVEASGSPA